MTKKMLVDATHPEETRVAIVDGNWLSDFDFERTSKKQLKGNIYLAKVIRIEPSLQAAFVEYGGNRHGFLSFSEIHPDYFRIPIADRPIDEVQDGADEEADDQDNEPYDAEMQEAIEAHTESYAGEASGESVDFLPAQDELPLADDSAEHNHEHKTGDMPSSDPAVVAASIQTSELHVTTAEFEAPPHDELGLITDFGNALVEPLAAPETVHIETVGGETIEDEQQYRRPPRRSYKIQEVVKRRQVMLIQVVKEERGNKGAALTTFLSLAGRYCVLMPNTDHGGGVSRKITSHQDRRRMKEILDQLEIPEGMAVILRTAGMEKDPPEIQRDLEHLLRLWNNIREQTLQSTAPALIYEEANLIKRSMRDLYSNEVSEILVAGAKGYQTAVDFMRTIMPDHLEKVKLYEEPIPLFFRYNVEKHIDQLYSPTVQLRSGGYIVINPTEALVSIDVNSGRSTRERHIESTALKTNLEAAEEIARQLRLRDLAGLVVIDFIDMEDGRNNAAVERRMKDAMRADRARLQIGRISPFGLLELSRQRLHPSLMEINFEKCPHCTGIGLVRSVDSAAISILRIIEEEAIRQGATELVLHIPTKVALYILNQKREALVQIEQRYNMQVLLHSDDALVPPDYRLERVRGSAVSTVSSGVVTTENAFVEAPNYERPANQVQETPPYQRRENAEGSTEGEQPGRRRGRYGAGRRNRPPQNNPRQSYHNAPEQTAQPDRAADEHVPYQKTEDTSGTYTGSDAAPDAGDPNDQQPRRGNRRRGRRGGRGRRGPNDPANPQQATEHYRAPNAPYSHAPQVAEPIIPRSVHELDTTPRDPRPSYRPADAGSSSQSSRAPYEVVSEADGDKPKGGWWRRLTGQ